MKIAIISDIHSNIVALDAVLEDISTQEVDHIFATGDLVGYLPFPNEVVNRMREYNVLSVKGNHDNAIVIRSKEVEGLETLTLKEKQASASGIYTTRTISGENRVFLKNLPDYISLSFLGVKLKLVHGSPNSISEYLYEDSEALEELSNSMDEDILVFGHTHVPFHKEVNGKHFMNAGSVGKPKHGNSNASYIIIHIAEEEVSMEFVEVSYDVESVTRVIKDNELISDDLIEMLEQGK